MDYLERAKRLVEIPLIHAWYEEQREKDRKFHMEQQEADVRGRARMHFVWFIV